MAQGHGSTTVDRFKGVPASIAQEIELYESQYFKEDLPIPFRGKLQLYPALVHDYEAFSHCSSCLTLNKNESVEGIRMSHLEYLYSRTQLPGDEGSKWNYRIIKLCEIVFRIKNGIQCTTCGRVIEYTDPVFLEYVQKAQLAQQNKQPIEPLVCTTEGCGGQNFIERIKFISDPNNAKKHVLYVDGEIINKDDFNRLRYIVLFQNYPDYRDDSWVDPSLKKDYEEKLRLERLNNDAYATLEKKIVGITVATHFSFEDVYQMSIRKFTMVLTTIDDLINYKIMKTSLMSGFVKLPKNQKLEHWLYKPLKDMYGDDYKTIDEAGGGAS